LRIWRRATWSPTFRSPTAIVWPPFVIVVPDVTVIVRVQPSTVLSETFEPSIAVIVIWPKPPRNPPSPSFPRPFCPRSPNPNPNPFGPPPKTFHGPLPSRVVGGLACPDAAGEAPADEGEGDATATAAAPTTIIVTDATRTAPIAMGFGPLSFAESVGRTPGGSSRSIIVPLPAAAPHPGCPPVPARERTRAGASRQSARRFLPC